MAYQVAYQESPGFLRIQVSGERSIQAVMELTAELTQKAAALGYQRLLIDVRAFEGWLRTMDSYHIVTREFPRYRGKGLRRVAIVDRELPEQDRWSFFETVARNRGFNLSIHSATEPAVAWLLEGLDLEQPDDKPVH